MKDPQFYLKKEVFLRGHRDSASCGSRATIDYHRYRRATYPILIVVTVLLLACVVGFGHAGMAGARRWLSSSGPHPQPARRDGQARTRDVALVLALEEGR